MADSNKIAQYSTKENSIASFSGHYTTYNRSNGWFTMNEDRAYFNGFLVAQWNHDNCVWDMVKLASSKKVKPLKPVTKQLSNGETIKTDRLALTLISLDRKTFYDNRDFILRQLSLCTQYIDNRKAFVVYQNDSYVLDGQACTVLSNIFQRLSLQQKIKLSYKYLELNTRFQPEHVFRFNKQGTITGVSLSQESIVDMYLIDNAEKLQIASYFLPKCGSLSGKSRRKKRK